MKFDKLRFVGANTVDLPIFGATPAGPFTLKGVDGLGPPEREVNISRTIREGGVRQGTRAANRQVVARIGLQPNWAADQTPEDLRTTLYGLMVPKFGLPLTLHVIRDDVVLAFAQGDISKMEASIFTEKPEVQITMDCDYPYLLGLFTIYQVPIKTVVGSQTAFDVENDGTAPAGFWTSIKFNTAPNVPIRISDNSSGQAEFMTIGGTWNANDTLIVDTRNGMRGVWRKRAGTNTNVSVIGDLTGSSTWLQLHGGNNRFLINNTAFDFTANAFGHQPAYLGV